MFIGGCAGSTACGIKIFRVQILFQFITIQLKKIIYPRGIFKIKYENSNIDENFFSDTDFIACMGIINRAMRLSLYNTPSKTGIKNLRTLFFL